MSPLTLPLGFACLIVTAILLRPYIAWARRGMIDSPNERSAHSAATPTGGGLVFLSVWLAFLALTVALGESPWRNGAALGVPAALLMGLGWVDDRHPLPAMLRLALQIALAMLFLWLWPWSPFPEYWPTMAALPALPALPVAAALFYLVYSTNITNFMDGIDGIVALQTLAFAFGALMLPAPGLMTVPIVLLAAAMGGFLLYNRPRARLFMGDGGSAPIGLLIAAITLAHTSIDIHIGAALFLLQGVFLTDSAVTLARRLIRGQNIAKAHSEHGYQHAARRWGHARVSYALFAWTMLIQLPIAWAIAEQKLTLWVLPFDFLLLAGLALAFRAGTARAN